MQSRSAWYSRSSPAAHGKRCYVGVHKKSTQHIPSSCALMACRKRSSACGSRTRRTSFIIKPKLVLAPISSVSSPGLGGNEAGEGAPVPCSGGLQASAPRWLGGIFPVDLAREKVPRRAVLRGRCDASPMRCAAVDVAACSVCMAAACAFRSGVCTTRKPTGLTPSGSSESDAPAPMVASGSPKRRPMPARRSASTPEKLPSNPLRRALPSVRTNRDEANATSSADAPRTRTNTSHRRATNDRAGSTKAHAPLHAPTPKLHNELMYPDGNELVASTSTDAPREPCAPPTTIDPPLYVSLRPSAYTKVVLPRRGRRADGVDSGLGTDAVAACGGASSAGLSTVCPGQDARLGHQSHISLGSTLSNCSSNPGEPLLEQ